MSCAPRTPWSTPTHGASGPSSREAVALALGESQALTDAVSNQQDAQRLSTLAPLQAGRRVQVADRAGLEQPGQRSGQPVQHHLGLRVAEPRVELHHPQALGGQEKRGDAHRRQFARRPWLGERGLQTPGAVMTGARSPMI